MLNPLQQDKLQILLHDDLLMGAVFQVFIDASENSRPKVLENENNTVLGEKYRAYELSKQIILSGFKELESYTQERKLKEQLNRAR